MTYKNFNLIWFDLVYKIRDEMSIREKSRVKREDLLEVVTFRIWLGVIRFQERYNYHTIALMSHASQVMLKILQARLQQYVNHELTDVQAGFRKGTGTRDQIANICWIIEKAREFQKNIYFFFTDYTKVFVWITINCEKF